MIAVVRAVTLPVAAPVGRSWEDLNAALQAAWRLSTHAANWCVQQLYRRDVVGQAAAPEAVKQGRADKGRFYAYGEAAREAWFGDWAGAKQSLNICLQYAHRKYLAERFDVCVRFKQNLLTVRHPYPFPVDADAWRTGYTAEDGKPSGSAFPTVALTLPGGEAFTLRLKRGPEFGRQLAMLRQLHDGAAKRGEAAVYRNGKGDVLLKLVGHFPRRVDAPPPGAAPMATPPSAAGVGRGTTSTLATESPPGAGAVGGTSFPRGSRLPSSSAKTHAMLLRTDPAAFLVAEVDGRPPWVLNCDHLRRWQAAHAAYRQRAAEDAKREKRMTPRDRANLNTSRELRCEKHRHRLGTAVHQITAQVARFCERQRVGVVVFDDAVRTYLPDGFPWHAMGEKLRYKLDEIGVLLVAADTADPGEYAGWLTDRSLVRATALAGERLVAGAGRKGPHPRVTPAGGSMSSPSRGRRKSSASAK